VEICFDPLRRYGAEHLTVTLVVLDSLGRVSECCRSADRLRLVAGYAQRMADAFAASASARSPHDREMVERALEETRRRLFARPRKLAARE
jgi:uncharacterized membrane protein